MRKAAAASNATIIIADDSETDNVSKIQKSYILVDTSSDFGRRHRSQFGDMYKSITAFLPNITLRIWPGIRYLPVIHHLVDILISETTEQAFERSSIPIRLMDIA